MVLRSWKIDPDKETILLQSGNTPTRMTALTSGHVDGALVSPESVHKIVASGCCRALADLADLPMDYARYGYAFPASYIKTQRETLRRLLMAYLEGIYVASECRGKGIGTSCLSKLTLMLMERCEKVCMLSNVRFDNAHKSFQKAGYRITGQCTTLFV